MYSFTSRVRYSESDQHSHLTLLALIDYFQDCSAFHTQSTSRTMEALAADGLAWMIACWNIGIRELPRLGDELVIKTWSYATKGIMADRSFSLESPSGTIYAQADSKWFLYGFDQGMPVRIAPEESAAYLSDEPRADLPPTKRKLKLAGELEQAQPIHVTEQLLDTNHHVNNAQYIELAREAADLPTERIAGCQVEYRAQATLGDTIVPQLYRADQAIGISLNAEDGSPYALVNFGLR